MINKKIIDDAFKFYNIDESYKEKCYKCAEEINRNESYKKEFNKVYKTLYYSDFSVIKELWNIKDTNDFFVNNINPFVTNLMIILGYEFHKNNMYKYKMDMSQISVHKNRVRECFENDLIYRKYDGVRISQMLWAIYFIRVRIIEIGRLQYEFIEVNPLIEEEYKKCIKIHIPSGERLLEQQVKESIIKSKAEILKYFNLDNPEYYCSSWLLSRQVNQIVDKNSNIAKFYNLFDVQDSEDGISDILNFVYNIKDCEDYTKLQEDTSLQIKIKKMLIAGKKINNGIGILKK